MQIYLLVYYNINNRKIYNSILLLFNDHSVTIMFTKIRLWMILFVGMNFCTSYLALAVQSVGNEKMYN